MMDKTPNPRRARKLRSIHIEPRPDDQPTFKLSPSEMSLVKDFRALNEGQKEILADTVHNLAVKYLRERAKCEPHLHLIAGGTP